MRFRQLGRSGLTVSVVGLGCNNLGSRIDEAQSRKVLEAALDAGVNFFDTSNHVSARSHRFLPEGKAPTADDHGRAEVIIGNVLGTHRDEVVIATKFGQDVADGFEPARAGRRYLVRVVEDSLRRLGTDHIDLYYLHRPDGRTPFEETLRALDDLVTKGKVLYVGSANLAAWQICHADWVARTIGVSRFICAQNRYNLLERAAELEILPCCVELGLGFVPFYPLANGLLTGKVSKGGTPPSSSRIAGRRIEPSALDTVQELADYASERHISLLEVAVGGLAARPAVASVICGATSPEQVHENAKAGNWVPSLEDAAALETLLGPASAHAGQVTF